MRYAAEKSHPLSYPPHSALDDGTRGIQMKRRVIVLELGDGGAQLAKLR